MKHAYFLLSATAAEAEASINTPTPVPRMDSVTYAGIAAPPDARKGFW